MIEQNPLEKNNSIDKAFEIASDSFLKHLNPEFSDDKFTQEKKKKLDKAFNDMRKIIPGKIVDIKDSDMFNILKCAFFPNSNTESSEKLNERLDITAYTGLGGNITKGDIERVKEDKWIIKTMDTLQKIIKWLQEEHRTLKRKGE